MTKVWQKGFRQSDQSSYYTLYPPKKRQYKVLKDNPADVVKQLQELSDDGSEYIDVMRNSVVEVSERAHSEPVELPAGAYVLEYDDYTRATHLFEMVYRSDGYVNLNNITSEIQRELNDFINSAELYKKLNTPHKTGILLYGPPGEGKTSLIRNLVNSDIAFKDAIIINVKTSFPTVNFLKSLNESTIGRIKIFIFEELTILVNEHHESEAVLSFLDGESSINNSITIATTNYPFKLPQNIINRPGRFDKIYKISSPDRKDRVLLLTHFYGTAPSEVELDITEGYSTAFLKEICMIAKVKQVSIDEAVKRVKAMFAAVKDDFKESKLGF